LKSRFASLLGAVVDKHIPHTRHPAAQSSHFLGQNQDIHRNPVTIRFQGFSIIKQSQSGGAGTSSPHPLGNTVFSVVVSIDAASLRVM